MFVTLGNNLLGHCESRLVGAWQSDEVVARAKPVAISCHNSLPRWERTKVRVVLVSSPVFVICALGLISHLGFVI
jgi:hypothetical protein